MKILKYITSVVFLAAVTLAALYFPKMYFQNYQHNMVIEDMEQHSYDALGGNQADSIQILDLLRNEKYQNTRLYSKEEKKDEEMEAVYQKMIRQVFQKYLNLVEGEISEETDKWGYTEEGKGEAIWNETYMSQFRSWIYTVLKEDEEWQINHVTVLYLTDISSLGFVTAELYAVSFEISYHGIVEILFNPDTEIFYGILILDDMYSFDESYDILYSELSTYYRRYEEPDSSIIDTYMMELMNMLVINIYERELSIRV